MVSRRSVFKGGGLLTVNTLRARIKERNEKENIERLRKAKKKLDQAKNKQVSSLALGIQVLIKNKQLKNLLAQGVQARKDKKARLVRFQELRARNELPLIEDIIPIREPDKDPTPVKKLLTIDEGHEGLVQVIKELEKLVPLEALEALKEQDNEVKIFTQAGIIEEEEEEEVFKYKDSSPVNLNVESIADSIDSI
jgi:hypothetical protein